VQPLLFGLMAILLVVGSWTFARWLSVAAAITVERLAPAGERVDEPPGRRRRVGLFSDRAKQRALWRDHL